MALYEVHCTSLKKGIHLTNYADLIIMDEIGKFIGMRFGGYPETVTAMTDAVTAGCELYANIGKRRIRIESPVYRNYSRKVTHDGHYAESVVILKEKDLKKLKKDEKETEKDEEDVEDEAEQKSAAPRELYIFCKTDSQDELYTELDKKLSVPLIPEFADYLIDSLYSRGQLQKLSVYSESVELCAYRLTVKEDESDLIGILEYGLKSGKISIPGNPTGAGVLDSIVTFSGYLNEFGTQIAERIKRSFIPLFEPEKEPICKRLTEINNYVVENAGYELFDAQLASAEGLKRELDKAKFALIVAECGTGKSKIGAAALYAHQDGKKCFNAIICPSHVSDKWVRELSESIPNCYAEVVSNFMDVEKLYRIYEQGDKSVYCVMSKERARDGYMKAPAVVWSNVKKAFVCPDCYKVQEMLYFDGTNKIYVEADSLFYLRETTANHKCSHCGTVLWSAINPDSFSSQWVKIGDYGFVHRKFASAHYASKQAEKYFDELTKLVENPNMVIPTKGAYRRYPLSQYIKNNIKKLDGIIVDELHEYSGDSGQGQAMADLARKAKKVIAMTATLINGYSKGMFYLLYRLAPKLMQIDEQSYQKSTDFCKEYGIVEKVTRFEKASINAMSKGVQSSVREKFLPGVSPLVYTRFLLDNAVFLMLDDMGKSLPEYEEIPVSVKMPNGIHDEYRKMEKEFLTIFKTDRRLAQKIMSSYLNLLSAYPDQPYGHSAVVSPLKPDDVLVSPKSIGDINCILPKDEAVLELVEKKIQNGERVIIYTAWTRLDTREKLLKLLSERGIHAKILDCKIPTRKREEWVDNQVRNGVDVLITNPKLVETGLDLNAFTTLIFFNLSFSLYVFRQASRRSWRINQTAPKVEVYMFYYTDTLQHKALKLMASKLAAATVIEGGISEEGLAAMSNCEDLTSQMAKELAAGIKDSVEDLSSTFKKMAKIKKEVETEKTVKLEKVEKQEKVLNNVIVLRKKPKWEESTAIQYSLFDLLAS